MALASMHAMTKIKFYKDLTVWQASVDLVDPYRFVFCKQLLSAGISIPSNIAEGSQAELEMRARAGERANA